MRMDRTVLPLVVFAAAMSMTALRVASLAPVPHSA